MVVVPNLKEHQNGDYCAHLIGLVGRGLEVSTCLYFDGLSEDFSLLAMFDLIERWFSEFDAKINVIVANTNGIIKKSRLTLKNLRSTIVDNPQMFINCFVSLQFYPKGRTTIEDTWCPSIYFACSLRAPSSAFFCVNRELGEQDIITHLSEGTMLFQSAAAYAFWFPKTFSPLGYYWGISVEPTARRSGAWTKRASRRLSHWRDNTKIGILTGQHRRHYSVCDGYVRDAYPLMLLSASHMARTVGDGSLEDIIQQRDIGFVTAHQSMFLWRIPAERLQTAQNLLDAENISLSSRRFEEPTPIVGSPLVIAHVPGTGTGFQARAKRPSVSSRMASVHGGDKPGHWIVGDVPMRAV